VLASETTDEADARPSERIFAASCSRLFWFRETTWLVCPTSRIFHGFGRMTRHSERGSEDLAGASDRSVTRNALAAGLRQSAGRAGGGADGHRIRLGGEGLGVGLG
jgi:hypothetical protein